tara:strand:+ start:2150 stop:2629 length:480 start_codon:yes stop_codon:yes gene_type:complete
MKLRRSRFNPTNRYHTRYRDNLWLVQRKRVYLYWFKFLKVAEIESDYSVDWSKYAGWGGSDQIIGQKFDDWWEDHWRELFAVKNKGDDPLYLTSTSQTKTDAYKIMLNVHLLKHLSNEEIGARLKLPQGQETHEMHSRVGRFRRSAEKILSNVCEGRFP